MLVTDHIALDARTAKKTREGFLVDEPRIARTGIQTYTAGELGLTDRAAADVIRVYRPEAEIFSQDSLRSFSAIDVTVDHPKGMVDAKNWRELAVGNTGEGVLRDGEFLRCPIIVKDQRAIDAIDAGKAELSVGYTCDLAMETGTTPTGEAYDAVQRNIRANHVALCDRARGGSLLRIGDHQGEPAVTLKTITFDGLPVADVSPAAEAVIVKLQGQVADAAKAKETADAQIATLTTEAATKDAQIATLTKQVEDAKITPAQLRDAAKAYATTKAQAKALAPDLTIGDDMDEPAIKKAVVGAKLGDAAKNWTDQQVEVSFATMAAGVKLDDADGDPLRQAIADHEPTGSDVKAVTDARAQMLADLHAGKVAQAAT